MQAGIEAAGDRPVRLLEHLWPHLAPLEYFDDGVQNTHFCNVDAVVFYGLEGRLPLIFQAFATYRTAVYVDLGYWGRRQGGRWAGYHKVCVNARHPSAYYRKPQHDRARINQFRGLLADPWREDGRHILLAGMGDKGALAEGFAPEQWEREAIDQIRAVTERPILYRPKPSWKKARPISGTMYSDPKEKVVEDELANCWAVVTHHSNVAIDGLVAGIPAFCWGGVAAEFSSQRLASIERPLYPDGRDAWMADIAYTQWSVAEMASGACWRHLRTEGLV